MGVQNTIGENEMSKRALYDVYCDKCLRFLISAPKESVTWCPRCSRISKLRPGEKPKKEDGKKDV